MHPTARPVTITATAVTAAILLTACTSSTTQPPKPLEHGTVKKKHHDAARPATPIYKDRYRETNCRTVTTNAMTLTGISRPTTGGTGSRSTTGGTGGASKVKPNSPNKLDKGSTSGGTTGGKSKNSTRRVCDRKHLGRVQTGWQQHPAVWKVLIVKGDRSRWKQIATEAKWRKIKVGDRI
ncbi:hypothetical protein AB0393_28415 [Streptomyces cyaneofuscatus]|uniref:hypothetical protein n=1 Tax=Streptomyces cyaneofuscatus TaxID=66883 RepID=UPI00344F9D9E